MVHSGVLHRMQAMRLLHLYDGNQRLKMHACREEGGVDSCLYLQWCLVHHPFALVKLS